MSRSLLSTHICSKNYAPLSHCVLFSRQRREHRVFGALLQMIPGLEERLMENSDEDAIVTIADVVSHDGPLLEVDPHTVRQIQKGASSARSDDTRSLKGAVLDWIVPLGQSLNPPLARNVKADRGFHHERTGGLLCPAGMDWMDLELIVPFYVDIRMLI
jgi:hypothetical protein